MNETLNELVAQKQEMEEIVKSLINLDLSTEDSEKELAEIEAKILKKLSNIDFVYTGLEAAIAQLAAYKELYKDELSKIDKKIQSIKKNKEKLLELLVVNRIVTPDEPLKLAHHTYSLAKTYGSVVITDESKIPQEYIKTKIEQVYDLAQIRKDLMSGKEVLGAELPVSQKVRRY